MSENGKIFKKIAFYKKKKKIIFISDNIFQNNFFENNQEKKKIFDLINFLKNNFQIKIQKIERKNKYTFWLTDENNIKFFISKNFKFNEIQKKILAMFGVKDFKRKNGIFLKNIVYINLIIKNKIFYCLLKNNCKKNY